MRRDPIHILRALRSRSFGETDASVTSARLPSVRCRRIYEPAPGRIFSTKAVALASPVAGRVVGYVAAPEGREFAQTRSHGPRFARDRARDRTAHPRARAQTHLQDRSGAPSDRPPHLG